MLVSHFQSVWFLVLDPSPDATRRSAPNAPGTASVEPVIGSALRGAGGKCLHAAGNGASGRSYCAPDPVSVQWIFGNSWLAKDRAPAIGYWFTGARRTDRPLTARALELGDPAQNNAIA